MDYDWEYQALKDIESLKLSEAIIQPWEFLFLNESTKMHFEMTEPYSWMLSGVFEANQIKAIESALKLVGITLIRGGAGSGKSKCVLGVLSAMLSLKEKQ